MALKKTITAEEHSSLAEAQQAFYVASGDGFALDVEGGFEDVGGLKSALEKERKAAREALARLKKMEGVDPEKYQELLAAHEKAEADKALKAGEFEGLKKTLIESHTKEKTKLEADISDRDKTIYSLLVSSQFSKSPLILEKTLLPPDIAETYFGRNFKVEMIGDKRVVVGYLNGQQILDTKGDPADFESALAVIIDAYPMKDRIFKSGAAGSGSPGGQGNNAQSGEKDPFKMTSAEKSAYVDKYGLEAWKKLIDQYTPKQT